ncbi:MAG: DUF2341 domain-containing protein, partial [Candidatus Thorarchaeota archaeon]
NNNLLDYWIESWDNTGSSIIWVKIPTLGTSTIYMYYGNPTATSLSNGTNTFIFFDDFLGSSLDPAKWDTEIGSYCGITVSSGHVRLYSQAPSAFVERAYMGFSESYFIQGTPYSWIHPSQNAQRSLAEDTSWFIEELHWTNLSSAHFFKNDIFDAEDTSLEDTTLPVRYIAQSVHGTTGGPYGAWIWTDDDTLGQLGRGMRAQLWIDLTNIADIRVDWVAVFKYNESNPEISVEVEITIYDKPPEIIINLPHSGEYFGTSPPYYSISVPDINFNTTWYSLNDGITNITLNNLTGTIDELEWDKKKEGPIVINFYANNTWGYVGNVDLTVIKEIASEDGLGIPGINIYFLSTISLIGVIFLSWKCRKLVSN